MSTSLKHSLRFVLFTGMALTALAIYQTEERTQALVQIRFRYKWLFLIGFFAAAFAVQAWLFAKPAVVETLLGKIERIKGRSLWSKLIGGLILAGGLPLIWVARFSNLGKLEPILGVTLLAVWWIMLAQALGLWLLSDLPWEPALLVVLMADGLLFQTYNVFQPVTQYPFSLGWSEASRYYYASLPFSKSIYGQALPLSVMHGTRYFMQSLPFIIKGLPLWADRLWQSILWVGVTGLSAWLAVRRTSRLGGGMKWILGVWLFLFFFQGAVYYHLQVCVIIILLGVSSRHPWRSLSAVLAASFWAGMSRLNWFPVPAMLAIMLYLLEEPLSSAGNLWRYLFKPAMWIICGLVAALLGQAFYIAVSGNTDLAAFGSSLTSDLLWYRLWPSDTYVFGIIPGIILVSLPAVILLYWLLRGRLRDLHPVRLLGSGAMLLVLFTGGLVVSTKIGGGGDLHNMDAYLVMLGLIVTYLVGQGVQTETSPRILFQTPSWTLLAFLLVIPVGLSFLKVSAPIHYNQPQAAEDLVQLRETTQAYSRSGEVLFIYERHLLTFNMIPDVPVVKDYEVVTLMEMAISGNNPYLDKFYQDINTHRFAAIVMRASNLAVNTGDFAEESNAWNIRVAYPVYCEYEPVLTLKSSNIRVYVPRQQRECPIPSAEETQP